MQSSIGLVSIAERFGAKKDQWFFLTGEAEKIQELAQEGFKLPAETAGMEMDHDAHMMGMEEEILHSDRFVLVDRAGGIRGYYEGISEEGLEKLRADIILLLRERR